MDLRLIAEEVAARLRSIDVVAGRTFAVPPRSVSPPAAVVSYPERVEYDLTYGRGADRVEGWPVVMLAGRAVDDVAARDQLYRWASGSGPESVKALLESGDYSAVSALRVVDCTIDVVTIAAVDYIAALFTLDIAGDGS